MPSNQRIEDYALIGDCASAALVARNGSIDWLCWPRFDSGACFAALLGEPEHGRWLIAPADSDARIERSYVDGSLILVTLFETGDGAVELVDFMPPHTHACDLVRIVRGLHGRVAMCTEFILRFRLRRSGALGRAASGGWGVRDRRAGEGCAAHASTVARRGSEDRRRIHRRRRRSNTLYIELRPLLSAGRDPSMPSARCAKPRPFGTAGLAGVDPQALGPMTSNARSWC